MSIKSLAKGLRATGVPAGFLEEVCLRKDGLDSQTILSSKSLEPPLFVSAARGWAPSTEESTLPA